MMPAGVSPSSGTWGGASGMAAASLRRPRAGRSASRDDRGSARRRAGYAPISRSR